jgi:hypothetical protein
MSLFRRPIVPLFLACLFSGCSGQEAAVVVDQRPEAEIQKEMEDYDKQQAADALEYEKQNKSN